MDPNIVTPQPATKTRMMKFLPWTLVGLFAVIIIVMVVLFKPWEAKIAANSRTVEVTGSATIKAEPDEFGFSPYYQFKGTDKTALIEQLTKKSDEIVAAIKKLGVEDKNIKSDASGYTNTYFYDDSDGTTNYSLTLTVTISSKDLAQKVQDYLVTTNPEGSVTPYSTFSKSKEKELQSKARDEATKDAREKADQSAKNLGFEVAQVKSVVDGDGFGGSPLPYAVSSGVQTLDIKASEASARLAVQPGENELSYSVKVVYYIK